MKDNLSILSREQKELLSNLRRGEEQNTVKLWSDVMTLADCGHTYSGLEKVYIAGILYFTCGACRVEREVIETEVYMTSKSTRDEARVRNQIYRTHVVDNEREPDLCKAGFSCLCDALRQNCKWCDKGRFKKCICGEIDFLNVTAEYFLIVQCKTGGGYDVLDRVIYLREKREHSYYQGSFKACSGFVDRWVANV